MVNHRENDIRIGDNNIVINQRIRQLINESKSIGTQQHTSFLVVVSILIVILIIASIDSETLTTSDLGIVGIILTFYMNYFIKSIDKRRELHEKIYEMGNKLYCENNMDKDNLIFFKKHIVKKYKPKKNLLSLLSKKNNRSNRISDSEKNDDKLSISEGIQDCYFLKDNIITNVSPIKLIISLIVASVILFIILTNNLDFVNAFEQFMVSLFWFVIQFILTPFKNVRMDVIAIALIVTIISGLFIYCLNKINTKRYINIFNEMKGVINRSKHEELYRFYNELHKKYGQEKSNKKTGKKH